MRGLKVHPRYEDLIEVAFSDGLENIIFPYRDASFFKKRIHSKPIRRGGDKTDAITTRRSKQTCI